MKHTAFFATLILLILSVGNAAGQDLDADCFERGGYLNEDGDCVSDLGLSMVLRMPTEFFDYPAIQSRIDEFYLSWRDSFALEFARGLDYLGGRPYEYVLEIGYSTHPYSEAGELVTIAFTVDSYTGGAHSNTAVTTFLLDLEADRLVELEDLFRPGLDPAEVLYPIVEPRLRGRLADLGFEDHYLDEERDAFRTFILTSEGIVFIFPPYTVAPYAFGTHEIEVPISAIRSRLAPEFRNRR